MTEPAINHEGLARRYRQRLTALLEKVETWVQQPSMGNHEALLAEAKSVRTQLDVEDEFARKRSGEAGAE